MLAPRSGFTLVESLVALVLFEFAMLALLAASAGAVRDVATARLMERARAAARGRVEALVSVCGAATVASTAGQTFREHWAVRTVGTQRLVTDSVVFDTPRGPGFVVARAARACP